MQIMLMCLVFLHRPPNLGGGNDRLSEISEAPPALPPRQRLGGEISDGYFDIPRARVVESERRRVIRTPSGRQVNSAHDYLINEYKEKQKLGKTPSAIKEPSNERYGK